MISEDIEKIIVWARQWAEYVDDDEVLKLWRKGRNLNIYLDDSLKKFDLTEIHKKYKLKSKLQEMK